MLQICASAPLLWLFLVLAGASAFPTDNQPATSRRFNCPFQDNLGFRSQELERSAAFKPSNELTCNFLAGDESTLDGQGGGTRSLSFHCVYSLTTGALIGDWNMGGCPIQAPRAPLTLNRRNMLPRSPVIRGLRMVDVRRNIMKTRTQLGAERARRSTAKV
ncbi:hypothetical protein BKA70DRAFT_830889 [Coprinopsis sp. MPI-PUGE-AT-0042]|nr:hypothetical protein BKA70DRAFT_170212 [Coprinopsis sp. MPI-PUGE-AT-0042]KAH6912360.1 hypothetical protein BKA70DRAFT_830889 [Coprinopsis sp. MPI-PUGE-AT-0042]